MTKSDDDTSIIIEIEENEPKLIENVLNNNNDMKSHTLLLIIFRNKKDEYTPKQFLNQSVEKTILLIKQWSNNGVIASVVCKNSNTKRDDYKNTNEIKDLIYSPCIIGKT